MRLEQYLRRPSRAFVMALTVLLTVGVGIADYQAGTDLSFSIFYLIPICLAAWHLGRKEGFIASVLATSAWVMADLMGAAIYSKPVVAYWNGLVRLGVFLVVAYLLAALKEFQNHLEEMVQKRTA